MVERSCMGNKEWNNFLIAVSEDKVDQRDIKFYERTFYI